MNILATIFALTLVVGQPASKPDFSGEWKMNVAKSDFGPLPPPTLITRSITHAEPALAIAEEQQSAMGDQKTTRKYVTDGTETTFDVNGATVKSAAKWADATLNVLSTADAIGITLDEMMSLSEDGKTLTSAIQIKSPQGDVTVTIVFERQ